MHTQTVYYRNIYKTFDSSNEALKSFDEAVSVHSSLIDKFIEKNLATRNISFFDDEDHGQLIIDTRNYSNKEIFLECRSSRDVNQRLIFISKIFCSGWELIQNYGNQSVDEWANGTYSDESHTKIIDARLKSPTNIPGAKAYRERHWASYDLVKTLSPKSTVVDNVYNFVENEDTKKLKNKLNYVYMENPPKILYDTTKVLQKNIDIFRNNLNKCFPEK